MSSHISHPSPPSAIPIAAIAVGVFALAFGIRAVFAMEWSLTPYGASPLLDAAVYDQWAREIAEGKLLRSTAFYQSPLLPYVLGLFYRLFGHDLLLVSLFNALLGAATAAIIALVTYRESGALAAAISGALAAVSLPLVFYSAPVMKEPLCLLLLSLFLLFALRGGENGRARDYAAAGAMLGLAALTRGNVLLLAPAIVAFAYVRRRSGKDFARNSAAFVAAMALCVFPATLHNYLSADDFVPINYTDGFNLYIGHSPTANGSNSYPPEVSTDPEHEERVTRWVAEQAMGRALKPSEISAYWRSRALDFAAANPFTEATLLKNKFLAFWSGAESFDNYDVGFISRNFDTIISWPWPGFVWISALAAFAAAAFTRRQWRYNGLTAALAAAYMVSVLAFYVTDRYRLPVVVFLLPLAGAALPLAMQAYRERKWRRLVVAAAASFVFVLMGLRENPYATDLTAFNLGTLAMIESDRESDAEALEYLNRAVAISPTGTGAAAMIRGSFSEERRGNMAMAEKWLDLARRTFPNDGFVWYNSGRLAAARGDFPAAKEYLAVGEKTDPSYALNHLGLAKIYEATGEKDRAGYHARRALDLGLDPQKLTTSRP